MANRKQQRATKRKRTVTKVSRRDRHGEIVNGFIAGMKILAGVLTIAKEISIRTEAQHDPPPETIDADYEVIPDELKQLPTIKKSEL